MAKKHPEFKSFRELLFFSYANLQMLCVAKSQHLERYNRQCFMVRSKAYKAYCEGRWDIHNLLVNNIEKIRAGNSCHYCGKEVSNKTELTVDHIFPQSKGGDDNMDNIMLVCKQCNSSKRDSDLLRWYAECRHEFPPIFVLQHYLKQIYMFSRENNLLDKTIEEIGALSLPFDYRYIPIDFPQPADAK